MNKEKNKKQTLKLIIYTIIAISTIGLIGFAYARYITSINVQNDAEVAKWNFEVTAGSAQNLIFYYDENMQNAMYKENNTIKLNGFFDANDNNKIATKSLYWAWPLETGSTAEEIEINDEIDTQYVGRTVTIGIVAKGIQGGESETAENTGVQCTFNAMGKKRIKVNRKIQINYCLNKKYIVIYKS